MARPRFLAMLNALNQCLDETECYLEVGTYQGGSLVGALMGNSTRAIAIDDFSQFQEDNSRVILERNLTRYDVIDRVTIHEMSYVNYFEQCAKSDNPPDIGVYYYDGNHSIADTMRGLIMGYPYVTPGGLMILDDLNTPEVGIGLSGFLGKYPSTRILFAVNPAEPYHPDWWHGTIVLQKA